MGDFDRLERERALTKKGDKGGGKKKCWCLAEGCYFLWTHSDIPGSETGYCGLHYHAAKGHESVEAWRKRDALAREDERRIFARRPRYDLKAKEQIEEPQRKQTIFDRAASRVEKEKA